MQLTPLEAYGSLLRFAQTRGEWPLRLAMHAAVAQSFRPEFLHLIKLNYLPDVAADPAMEADVLQAPFCEDIGAGYYQFDAHARALLTSSLVATYAQEPASRLRSVAAFLIAYVDENERAIDSTQDRLAQAYIEVQRWVALAILDPADTASQLAFALNRTTASSATVARLQLGGILDELSEPLLRYPALAAYATGVHALEQGQVERAREAFAKLTDRELQIGSTTLRPVHQVFAAYGIESESAHGAPETPRQVQNDDEHASWGPVPHANENGFRVLVDGTERDLPPGQVVVAEALGAALASAGFSLVTLGTSGVAYLAARGFLRTLRERGGHKHGLFRITTFSRNGEADFPHGRRLRSDDPVRDAMQLADIALFVGSSESSAALVRRDRPAQAVMDCQLAPTSHWSARIPEATSTGADDYCAWGVARIARQFHLPPPRVADDLDGALNTMERALDAPSLTSYNRYLKKSLSLQQRRALLAKHRSLVSDPRCCSRRLLAYELLEGDVAPDLLADALAAELDTVRWVRETRPLWLALKQVKRASTVTPRLAAAFGVLRAGLASSPGADDGGACRAMMEACADAHPLLHRAYELAGLGLEYERVRNSMAAGPERTTSMAGVVKAVSKQAFGASAGKLRAKLLSGSSASDEAWTWFASGYAGQRIVAIAALNAAVIESGPAAGGVAALEIGLEVVKRPRSPFEQFQALRLLHGQLTSLSREQCRRLVEGLREASERVAGKEPTIYLQDPPCAAQSELLLQLGERLLVRGNAHDPHIGDVVDAAQFTVANYSLRRNANSRTFDWCVFIAATRPLVHRIQHVDYHLHETFQEPAQSSTDAEHRFVHVSSGWGEFMIRVTIILTDGATINTEHWLRLADDNWPRSEPPDVDALTTKERRVLQVLDSGGQTHWRQLATIIKNAGLPRRQTGRVLESMAARGLCRMATFDMKGEPLWGACSVVGRLPSLDEP